jgi:hypothetical protein
MWVGREEEEEAVVVVVVVVVEEVGMPTVRRCVHCAQW